MIQRKQLGWALTLQWLLALLSCEVVRADANQISKENRFDYWKTEDGLPQNTVKAVLRTHDGYLWLGTRFGLVRYDGVKFRIFSRVTDQTMQDDNCINLVEGVDHILYIGFLDRLCLMRSNRFEWHGLGGDSASSRMWSMSKATLGGVWIGATDGLRHFKNGKFTRFRVADGLKSTEVKDACEDAQGTLWIAGAKGLQTRDPTTGKFTEVLRNDGSSFTECLRVVIDNKNVVWVATARDLSHGDGKSWRSIRRMETGAPTKANWLGFVHRDPDDRLWFGTTEGLYSVMPEGIEGLFSTPPVFKNRNPYLSAFADDEDNVWMGTGYDGLIRKRRRNLISYTMEDGLLHNNVWSVAAGRNGSLWIGTDLGVSHLTEGRFESILIDRSVSDSRVHSVLEDSQGQTWVGTKNSGLLRVENGKLVRVLLGCDLEADQVGALYEDPSGTLWVGTQGALYRRENEEFTRVCPKSGPVPQRVRVLLRDREGGLWIGTYGMGLLRMSEGATTVYRKADGLCDDYIFTLHEDADGVLWVGTENGLNRLRHGRWTSFRTKEGLFDNTINSLMEDSRGHFWISCNRGLFEVDKAELNKVAEGGLGSATSMVYGADDGMESSETNGEYQPSASRAADGKFWFPTTSGVIGFDPLQLKRNEVPPPVVIEEVLVDGSPRDMTAGLRVLPADDGTLEIRYTANSLVAPEKVRFERRLEGRDSDWKRVGDYRVAFYNNLKPGQYVFRVRAFNNHGVQSRNVASVAFYWEPRFYQTYSFYAAVVLAIGALLLAMHRWRIGVLRRIQGLEQLHALDKERGRIAQEMHDDLGASLTQISVLTELCRRDSSEPVKAVAHLERISDSARKLFRAMDEIVWAVNPSHDTLASLVNYLAKYAQSFLGVAEIRCRLDLPNSMPKQPVASDKRHQIFLAAKEALNNLVKHSGATEAWLRVEIAEGVLRIGLEDNGRGFEVEGADPSRNGLRNMRERLGAIGGGFELISSAGGGSRITFTIPLAEIAKAG